MITQVISALAAETSSSGNALKIYLFAQSPLALSPPIQTTTAQPYLSSYIYCDRA